MRVSAAGRSARPGDDVFDEIIGADSLHAALAEADYVVDALPLTEATHRLFDARAFAAMKPTARFINIGRGVTVDEAALADAVRSQGIAGAALDVFEKEPPADSPLLTAPNVVFTPHLGASTHEAQARAGAIIAEQVGKALGGQRPDFLVNPAAYT